MSSCSMMCDVEVEIQGMHESRNIEESRRLSMEKETDHDHDIPFIYILYRAKDDS